MAETEDDWKSAFHIYKHPAIEQAIASITSQRLRPSASLSALLLLLALCGLLPLHYLRQRVGELWGLPPQATAALLSLLQAALSLLLLAAAAALVQSLSYTPPVSYAAAAAALPGAAGASAQPLAPWLAIGHLGGAAGRSSKQGTSPLSQKQRALLGLPPLSSPEAAPRGPGGGSGSAPPGMKAGSPLAVPEHPTGRPAPGGPSLASPPWRRAGSFFPADTGTSTLFTPPSWARSGPAAPFSPFTTGGGGSGALYVSPPRSGGGFPSPQQPAAETPGSHGRRLSQGGGASASLDTEEQLDGYLSQVERQMKGQMHTPGGGSATAGRSPLPAAVAAVAVAAASPPEAAPPAAPSSYTKYRWQQQGYPRPASLGGCGSLRSVSPYEDPGDTAATAAGTYSPSAAFQSTPSPLGLRSPGALASPAYRRREGDVPLAMSFADAQLALGRLGISPAELATWRDRLRQWFSERLLGPLEARAATSHLRLAAAAASLGISLAVRPLGGDAVPLQEGAQGGGLHGAGVGLLQGVAVEEGLLLQQLRSVLQQARDSTPAAPAPSAFGLASQQQQQQQQQQLAAQRILADQCLSALTEHERLLALLSGRWAPSLLAKSPVPIEYTVQRIRQLAEGTCVRNFEWGGGGAWLPAAAQGPTKERSSLKAWTPDLPDDSHLLFYLFCAFLEYPGWAFHADSTAALPSVAAGGNPLYVADVPSPERAPPSYVAVVGGPLRLGSLPAGACMVCVGQDTPPAFGLYWNKRQQLNIQGITAVWDAVLLLLYWIKAANGGIIRGVSLDSDALDLLDVLSSTDEE